MVIQVTALLSSIALCLALPKVDTEQSTLSDRMSTITYAAVALMSGLKILKESAILRAVGSLHYAVIGLQRIAFPIATVVATLQLFALAACDGASMWMALQRLQSSIVG